VNWEGSYNSNTQQEFPVSLAINNEGIYVLEDSISNSDLLKFKAPIWNDSAISSLFCVDSVWYDAGNPNLVHVSVFNGNIQSVNYPVVHIVSPLGDTISNLSHTFSFFAQMGNSHTEYVDTITVQGIADFSNYTFHMHEGIWDRNFDFGFCTTTGIENIDGSQIVLFPNPASETIFIRNAEGARIDVFDMTGKLVIQQNVSDDLSSIDVSVLVDGAYVVRVVDKKFIRHFRVICD
jgi:hypothetical protein